MGQMELHIPSMDNFYVKFYHAADTKESDAREYISHVDDSVELFVLEEGDVSFLVGGSLYRMEPGDIIISKPNEVHNCIQNSRCVHKHFCFWFSPACDSLLSSFVLHSDGEGNLVRLGEEKKRELLALCYKICDATEQGNKVGAFSAAVAILELCRGALSFSPKAQALPKELLKVLEILERDIAFISSIKELCEHSFISQSTLLRLFRRYLGVSPHIYLETRRLAMARNYLKEGKSVTETALLTGFADVSAFIRLFRQRFGMTPLKYRQKSELP